MEKTAADKEKMRFIHDVLPGLQVFNELLTAALIKSSGARANDKKRRTSELGGAQHNILLLSAAFLLKG